MTEECFERKWLLRCIYLSGLLLISLIAFMVDPGLMDLNKDVGRGLTGVILLLRSELRTVEPAHVLAMLFLVALYKKELLRGGHKFCLTSCIVGAILSMFLLIGMSLETTADFDFIAGRKCQMVIACIVFLGYWVILYACLKWLFEKMDSICVRSRIYVGILKRIDKNFLIISICVLLLCWTILRMAFFPGSIPYDGRYELNQYFRVIPFNLHHPLFSTMIMGVIYELGSKIGGITGGTFLYVVFQSLLGAIVFGLICNYVYKKSKSMLFGLLTLAYFAIVPVWWAYLQAIMKDGLYTIAFAWFVLEYIKIFLGDKDRYSFIRLFISAMSVCVLRNGTIMIVLPALIVLLIILSDKKKAVGVILAAVCIANCGLNILLTDWLHLKSKNQVEALSIPLQQIARCVTLYEDEITEEEAEIIDRVVMYEGIPERYNPVNSDPIKDKYRNTTKAEWEAFWKLWLKKLKEHPMTYVTATMNHIYGYIDPFYFFSGLSQYPFYIKDALGKADEGIVYAEYLFSDNCRNGAANAAYIWNKVPGASFLVNAAFDTWVSIILIGGLLRKRKWRHALLFVVPLINTLICFASPVNGYLRYAMPVMAAMPLYILLGLLPYLQLNKDAEEIPACT